MRKSFLLLSVFVIFLLAGATYLVISNLGESRDTRNQAFEGNSTYTPPSNRTAVPAGTSLLNNGIGITNNAAMTAGNFQVEGYCSRKNMGAVSRTSTDWKCGSTTLQATHFDEICRMTYNNNNAFALKTATNSEAALNWRCYGPNRNWNGDTNTGTLNGPLTCGSLCGGQDDGQLLPITCPTGTICGNNKNGGTTGNRCIPLNAPGYVGGGGICKNDPNKQVYCLNKANGERVQTVEEIQAACAAMAGTNPGSGNGTNTGANISDLNKNGKADVDDYRLFRESYLQQLSKQ